MERYIRELQQRAYANKIQHNFNVTNIEEEFCLLYGEVAEAYDAWRKQKTDVGEELADIAIYLLGLAEILHIDLGAEILAKMDKNQKRQYDNKGIKITK